MQIHFTLTHEQLANAITAVTLWNTPDYPIARILLDHLREDLIEGDQAEWYSFNFTLEEMAFLQRCAMINVHLRRMFTNAHVAVEWR